jgi:IS5 family transposase
LAITPAYGVVEGQLSGGNIADITMADALTAEVFGCYVVEDMGYDSDDHRATLQANNNIPVIPGRKNRKVPIDYDKQLYALRCRIEMFFGRIKQNRRLAVRYEKTALCFLGFIACAILMNFDDQNR